MPGERCEGGTTVQRKRPSTQILEIYRLNRERLNTELQKPEKDRLALNNIHAYRHIVQSMEQVYDLGPASGN